MASFALEPVDLGLFAAGGPHHHAVTVLSPWSVSDIWSALHQDRPLGWCSGIRSARWTSPRPHGVGATRQVRLATGVRLDERYFLWQEEETECVNAFSVESASLPAFRRFGERYHVNRLGTGWSRLTWEFYIEPRLPGPLLPAANLLIARDIAAIRRDTLRHFGIESRPARTA